MADLRVESLELINPFVVASSPATQGVYGMLKSAAARPGAIVMRNFGHGAGGGSLVLPSVQDLRAGKAAVQSHAIGVGTTDGFDSLQDFCDAVSRVRREMPGGVKLWVSVGHFGDAVRPGIDWETKWVDEAGALEEAGADALELHFNTPGVSVARNRVYDFNRLIYNTTKSIKQIAGVPIMVKLPVESCDPLRAMEAAVHAGADAVGPTARWKAFLFDLDWRRSKARPGGGYGGTQMLPIACYTVAEARMNGIDLPMYAGGGVFTWEAAAKLIMAGSQSVQLGTLACCAGPGAVEDVIRGLGRWMDESGYASSDDLCGDALNLFSMSEEQTTTRLERLGEAYRTTTVDEELCVACAECADVCWFDAIEMSEDTAIKGDRCIGCGYCFDVCSTGALSVPASDILASVFD